MYSIGQQDRRTLSFFTVVFSALLGYSHASNASRHDLAINLLRDYDGLVIPEANLTVSVGFSLSSLWFDRSSHILTSFGWMDYSWHDNQLVWDPTMYGNIGSLRLPSGRIWTPDIMLYGGRLTYRDVTRGNAALSSDGTVAWVPAVEIATSCVSDTEEEGIWNCRYKFGSWSYDGLHIYLVSKGDVIEPEVDIADDSEWKVVKKDGYKNVVRYPCCPGSYIDITYTISISGSEKLRMGIVLMLIMLTTGIGCQ